MSDRIVRMRRLVWITTGRSCPKVHIFVVAAYNMLDKPYELWKKDFVNTFTKIKQI